MKKEKIWYVYIVECSDGTFYTGITSDILRRMREHNYSNSKGAKYTRGRAPVEIIHCENHENRSKAQIAEAAFKKLTRKKKEEYVGYETTRDRRSRKI